MDVTSNYMGLIGGVGRVRIEESDKKASIEGTCRKARRSKSQQAPQTREATPREQEEMFEKCGRPKGP